MHCVDCISSAHSPCWKPALWEQTGWVHCASTPGSHGGAAGARDRNVPHFPSSPSSLYWKIIKQKTLKLHYANVCQLNNNRNTHILQELKLPGVTHSEVGWGEEQETCSAVKSWLYFRTTQSLFPTPTSNGSQLTTPAVGICGSGLKPPFWVPALTSIPLHTTGLLVWPSSRNNKRTTYKQFSIQNFSN